jgi:hypothetical protein
MRVRALREIGIQRFRDYLAALRDEPATPFPEHLITDESCSLDVRPVAEINPKRVFADKMDFGRYLVESLAPLSDYPRLASDVGLWSWLALCYFEALCPSDGNGRDVKAEHRYILSQEPRNHYRHLVRTPWNMYSLHGHNAAALLSGSPDTHGEASEQILGREFLRTNKGLFEAIDRLYVRRSGDSESWQLKKGARSKDAPGTMRRLGKVVRQFDLTFDLYGMNGSQIFELLPDEFRRFKVNV